MGDRQILFQVYTGKHEYLIYTDGSIEGFGDMAINANYFPELIAQLVAKGILSKCRMSPTDIETSLPSGAAHTIPP